MTVQPVAIELSKDLAVETALAYETAPRAAVEQPSTGDAVEARVREYFSDIPIMIRVAYCESNFEQREPSGEVKRGRVNARDVGVMQINEYYHEHTAASLKLDLHTLEDNLAYARYLYERQGTQPWSASRACWQAPLAMR